MYSVKAVGARSSKSIGFAAWWSILAMTVFLHLFSGLKNTWGRNTMAENLLLLRCWS